MTRPKDESQYSTSWLVRGMISPQSRSKQRQTNGAPTARRTISPSFLFLFAAGADSCSSSEVESENQTTVTAVTAVTVDFFRKGSYSPALPATAPLLDSSRKHKPKLKPSRDAAIAIASSQEESSRREAASTGGRERSDWAGGGDSDTEAGVCVLWLQVNADVFFFIF